MDYEGNYVMGWRFNDTDIEFELTVKTTGYIGFGISEQGLMNPADMLIGWISQGSMYLGVSSPMYEQSSKFAIVKDD